MDSKWVSLSLLSFFFFSLFSQKVFAELNLEEIYQKRKVERKSRLKIPTALERRQDKKELAWPGGFLSPRIGFAAGAAYVPTFGSGPVNATGSVSSRTIHPLVGLQFGYGRKKFMITAEVEFSPYTFAQPSFASAAPWQWSIGLVAHYRALQWLYVGAGIEPFRAYRVAYSSGQRITSLGLGFKLSASARLRKAHRFVPRLYADFSFGRFTGVRTSINNSAGNFPTSYVVKSGFTGWVIFTTGVQFDWSPKL